MPKDGTSTPRAKKSTAMTRRPRGPSLEKTAQTQQAIARAAQEEFFRVGIAKATMAGIAERAQVAKGTIYLYFKSKEELLEGVIDLYSASLFPLEREPLQPGESVQQYLRRTLLPLLRTLESSGRADLARLVLTDAGQHPELAALYRQRMYEPWAKHVNRMLKLAVERGELPNDAALRFPQLAASPLWMAMVHNGMIAPARKIDIAAMYEAFLDVLFAVPCSPRTTKSRDRHGDR